MASSPDVVPDKLVVDAIHGDVHLTAREWAVVDTASFQRLRRLKQLAMGESVYPNATHTRFAHSLGVLAVMARVLDVANSQGVRLSKRERENLRLAALLHDVGHYPYSHLMEKLDKTRLTEEQISRAAQGKRDLDASRPPYPNHEALGALIVTRQPDLVRVLGDKKRARAVSDILAGNPQLSKLVHSSLDMDRLDFLVRDARATGVPYGEVDINYLLNHLAISPTGMLGVSPKALPAAEHFLLARFFMYRTVYYHKTTYGLEECCRQLLRRLRDKGEYEIPVDGEKVRALVTSSRFGAFTDAFVDGIIQEVALDDDPVCGTLARAVRDRRPPKLLKEVLVLRHKREPHHAGSAFKQNCRHHLGDLSENSGIPPGQFLLCETLPLELEPRGRLLTAEEARSLRPEEEEELIKVFVQGEREPKALVEIPHSLISQCASYVFQSFRLYVVYEGQDRDARMAYLRGEVRNWDRP